MITLQNDFLQAVIHPKGAELQSLKSVSNQLEYIWNGDPAYWGKHSPALFPVVGALKNDIYQYKGVSYTLPRHGFAREHDFNAEKITTDSATFSLSSTVETHKNYPFDFILKIRYQLSGASLKVTYEVTNPSNEILYFSIGGHPAFAVPLEEGKQYEDYYLQFDQPVTARRWPIIDGLIAAESEPFLENESKIPLKKSLFYEDAVVFKHIQSSHISLKSDVAQHGLHFSFEGFPYLGIWAAKDASFVCIEPWCGIADSILSEQQLAEKEGILSLTAGEKWQRCWSVECF